MRLDIEFSIDEFGYYAYIGQDGASGIEVSEPTKEAMLDKVSEYIKDLCFDLESEFTD